MNPHHWIEVTPSEYPWERDALAYLKEGLPDGDPFRAWSNFEFIAHNGSINEVDLLVVSLHSVFLVEIKSWRGVVAGDQGTWRRTVNHREFLTDNPLCQAVAAYYTDVQQHDGWSPARLPPLLAVLHENLPWLKQWHNDIDPEYDQRLGDFYETFLRSELTRLGLTEEDLRVWTPPNTAKSRRRV